MKARELRAGDVLAGGWVVDEVKDLPKERRIAALVYHERDVGNTVVREWPEDADVKFLRRPR